MTDARAFRGIRFPAEGILWAVRWYLQFPVSYRDLERMLADRGVEVDHTTIAASASAMAAQMSTAVCGVALRKKSRSPIGRPH